MTQMDVRGIILEPATGIPIVILMSKNNLVLPIFTGPFEANAIALELKGLKPPRPLTHDIIASFFMMHGIKTEYLHIYDMFEDVYFARIHYRKGLKRYEMELRPSDGIAIAMKLNIPIFAEESLLENESIKGNVAVHQEEILPDDETIMFLGDEKVSDFLM